MKLIRELIARYPIIRNKYFITTVLFLTWIIFFDKNNLLSQFEERHVLFELKKEKRYYQNEIKSTREQLNQLMTNNATLEKFAREKYLMKKDNEEIWLVIDEESKN